MPLDPLVSSDNTIPPEVVTPTEDQGVSIGAPAGSGDGLPLVSLPVQLPSPMNPTSATVEKRAFKTVYGGLSELLGQSEEGIKAAIGSGQEEWIRREAAAKIDFKNSERRNQKIAEAARNGPLDPEQVKRLVDPFNPEFKRADPQEVIERAYATSYVSSLNTAQGYMQDNFLGKAEVEIPNETAAAVAKSSTLAATREFISTKVQDIQDAYEKQGWIGWTADQVKLLAQPYSEFKLRALVKEVGALDGGLLLGNNIQKTVDAILDMPGPQMQKTVTTILDKMKSDNPSLALMFGQYLLGQSTSDRRLNNIFTVLAPLDLTAGIGGTHKLAQKVGLYNSVQRGYRDLVKSLEVERPTRATIAEAAGNVEQSSIIKAAENIIKGNDATLNPTVTAKESLMTGFLQDVEKLGTNTGSFVREAVVRIQNGVRAGGERLLLEAEQRSKVNRIPQVLAVEQNVAVLRAQEVANYRGPKNTLLDIADPVKNEITNTWHWPTRIGNFGNTLFSSAEAAENFARQLLKIDGFTIAKKEGDILQNPGGLTGSKSDLAAKARLEKSIPLIEEAAKKAHRTAMDIRLPMRVRKEAADTLRGEDSIPNFVRKYKAQLAEVTARLKPEDAIVQKGIGFYIERNVPLKENDPVLKNLMIKDINGNFVEDAIGTSSASGFNNIRNGLFGWIRGANHTLSKNEMMQRNTATFSTTALRKWAADESLALHDIATGKSRFDEVTGEPLPWYKINPRVITGDLSFKEVKEQFTRTLKHAQDAEDPITKKPGYFYKTLGELEDHYLRFFERPPSFNEANAYFTYVKLVEAERVLMEISEYKYRSRVGVEQHQFWFNDGAGRISSGFIDGVDVKHVPRNTDNILILGDRQGEEILTKANKIDTKQRARLEQQVQDGQKKVIQLYATGQRPLAEFSSVAGNERVVFVIADNIETKPLDYNHVVRRGGGHFDFDYDFYIKQPIVTHSRSGDIETDKRGGLIEALYEGDRTFMPVDNRAMGRDLVRKMNDVIALMHKKDFAAAEAKFIAHKLPMEWEKFKGYFLPTKLGDKVIQPRYSTAERFEVVQKGHQIADMNKDLQIKYESAFRDGTRSGDLSKQFQVEYNKERDSDRVYSIHDRGSPGSPDYEYQPASMVDPMASFDRSLNRMINSSFMDDYKIYTVEHWLREASPYLKAKESELFSAPFAHFVTPEWKSGLNTLDLAKISNLLSNRYKARQFIGMPSKFDTMMYQLQQNIADNMWEETNKAKRAALLVPHWMLPYHTEPVSAIRALTYNLKLGLYALPQLFTQLNSWTTTITLEPRAGAAGTYASLLHSWGAMVPKHIDYLDNMATKMDMGKIMLGSSKWKLGEFKEAREALIQSGFLNVGGEMADLDRVFNNSVFTKKGIEQSGFVRAGQKPFQWGEKAARVPAWYTAYRNFRDANPFGELTEMNKQEILHKANVLTNNMTRASNSMMNEGILSLPMQFLSYQQRLAETFAGKEIGTTTGERSLARMRMMAGYGALYGIPSAIGVTGLPMGDNMRRYAIDNLGYVPGEHWAMTALMEGWPALFMNKASGGNNYDVGGKWGTKGMTTVDDLLKSDSTWLRVVGGAGIDTVYKFLSGFDGWYKATVSFARQDPEDKRYRITTDDLLKPTLEASSANAIRTYLIAVNTGKWVGKNDSPIKDVSKADALFMSVTGLRPAEQAYQWDKAEIVKEEQKLQKDAMKLFIQNMARSEMAAKNKDPSAAHDYMKNGFIELHRAGYSYDKILAAIAIAKKNNKNSSDRADWDFAFGDSVPLDKRPGRKDQYIRSQKLKEETSR